MTTTMTQSARHYMDTVLTRLQQDQYGRRAAPTVSLSPDTADLPGGGLRGTIEVRIRTRDGDERVIHREPFDNVVTNEQVDDVFARTLSVVLMNHSDWPR